jgi:copper chaperone
MIRLTVPDMTCGHCVATITKAIQAADAAAQVKADVGQASVDVVSDKLSGEAVLGLVTEAGYTPRLEASAAQPVVAGGCGCGGAGGGGCRG